MKIRHVAFAVFLAAGPVSGALAQQTTSPSVGAADGKADNSVRAGSSTHTSGATGQTVVAGDNSTIAGDKSATKEQKTGATATNGTGGK